MNTRPVKRPSASTAPLSAMSLVLEEVRGDNNAPTLSPGQHVTVDLSDRSPSPPGFFLCWDGLGKVIRRVEVIPNTVPLLVRLLNDNPKYISYESTLEDAQICGRVVGSWTRI